jgi:hypothetical protein
MPTLALVPESSLVVSILGIPVSFETNSTQILEAVRASYDPADIMPFTEHRGGPRVRVLVTPDVETVGTSGLKVQLPERNRLVLGWGDGEANADAVQGEAVARVRPGAAEVAGFRERVLDHLALFLVTYSDRHPLHAAGIERDGKAVLLFGPSGLGKSSLTYAAMRAGWKVLADDAIYVQSTPYRGLWGVPRRIHLPAESVRYFPELESMLPVQRPDGRLKIAVEIPAPARAPVPWTGEVGLCLLTRRSGAESPERVTADEAADEMRQGLQGGFERFAGSLDECITSLASDGACWRLPVRAEPAELAGTLRAMFHGSP